VSSTAAVGALDPIVQVVSATGPAVAVDLFPDFGWLSRAVETATGWAGLIIIFVYSFLIAFALPGVSEVVLLAPLNLGLSEAGRLTVIILTSGLGKALGSVFAFHIGQEAKESGPIIRFLRRSRFDVIEWSERRTVEVAQKWGYAGLAAALSVPFFPDTISIYAFAVLEEDYAKFAAATFVGSVGRLVVTIIGVGTVLSVV
jgi:membrane protein YqaA with SNARE-associated domain